MYINSQLYCGYDIFHALKNIFTYNRIRCLNSKIHIYYRKKT